MRGSRGAHAHRQNTKNDDERRFKSGRPHQPTHTKFVVQIADIFAITMKIKEEEWDCADWKFTSFAVLVGDPSAP